MRHISMTCSRSGKWRRNRLVTCRVSSAFRADLPIWYLQSTIRGLCPGWWKLFREKGYQYYDWNLDSTDAAGGTKDDIVKNACTDKINHVVILFHDAAAKAATVEALPEILEYYSAHGYEFRGIDRESYVCHHGVQN